MYTRLGHSNDVFILSISAKQMSCSETTVEKYQMNNNQKAVIISIYYYHFYYLDLIWYIGPAQLNGQYFIGSYCKPSGLLHGPSIGPRLSNNIAKPVLGNTSQINVCRGLFHMLGLIAPNHDSGVCLVIVNAMSVTPSCCIMSPKSQWYLHVCGTI